ncbi:MAG: ABC transporter substrate-binding protein [Nitrospinota bacterium]|nr:ABC transporter substrate-binding protein [Nitrospinota bacterium]
MRVPGDSKARGFAWLAALCFAIPSVSAAGEGAAEKIKFNMSSRAHGSIAGFVVALARGFYKKEGLDVDLKRGYGALRTVDDVADGLFQFGWGAPEGIVLNRTKGGRTLMVGAINDTFTTALCYDRAKMTLAKPRDLAGKKVGVAGFSPIRAVLPILMDNAGAGGGKIAYIKMKPARTLPSLFSGKTDVAACRLGSDASIVKMAAVKKGVDIGVRKLSDLFGLDVYGNGIITSRELMDAKPRTIGRFVRASYRGYAWMSRNMAAAADLVVKRFPTLKRPIVLDQARATDKLMKGPNFPTKGYGWIDRAKMKRTRDFTIAAWNIKMDIPLDEIYTNRYLAGSPIQ